MDSYIALTLFGCFFVLVFIGVPIFVLNRYCHCSFNAVDVSLGYRGNHCFAATG